MPKYKVIYPRRGYTVGQVVEPPATNVPKWESRNWAVRIDGRPKVETAAERVNKPVDYRMKSGGWADLLDADGNVVDTIRGEDAARQAVGQ